MKNCPVFLGHGVLTQPPPLPGRFVLPRVVYVRTALADFSGNDQRI